MSQLVQGPRKSELVATHVEPATRDQLIALARNEDRSLSAVLRRALDRELERANTQGGEAA